jgi:hypothetical protein
MRREGATACALLFLLTGCDGPSEPAPRPAPPPAVTSAPEPTSGPACTAAVSTVAPAAEHLAGDWICRRSTTEMRFRFSSDGRYESRESLEYDEATGRFVFHRDQEGEYRATGNRLELTPSRSTRTRRAPDDPANDYVDKPEVLTPRLFTFRATPTALNLHEDGGYALVLVPIA